MTIKKTLLILLILTFSLRGEKGIRAGTQAPTVLLGIDILEENNFEPLRDKRIGLVTNDAARDGQGRRTLDVLKNAPGLRLVAVFSPEHGLSALAPAGKTVGSQTDSGAALPIYSLYGDTRRPSPETLKGLDVLVLDLQDSGARFYTYSTTMAYCLEEAARAGIEFMVLDRPNPVTGDIVEGPVLEDGIDDFTAHLHIPIRHGLTMGELACFHDKDARLKARLSVVPLKGWKRTMWWEETGLSFVAPSPNIRTPTAALLYAGIGCFEATNVSAGRGTAQPFEIFGAPWLNARRLAKELNAAKLGGVKFKTTRFTPANDLYAAKPCQGVQIIITDRNLIRPVDIFVYSAILISRLHSAEFRPRWDEVAKMTGSHTLENAVKSGGEPGLVCLSYRQSAGIFKENNKDVWIYGK